MRSEPRSEPRVREIMIRLGLFVVVLLTHFAGVITSSDSRWSIPTARSLLYQRNTDLNEYPRLLEANRFYAIETINGRVYSMFPIGPSLLALPVVAVIDAVGARLDNGKTEKLVASLIVALTATLLYGLARQTLGVAGALALTFVFAFCTAAWSTASRALWPHGPSMLMLTLALWLIMLAKRKSWVIQLVSLPLACSYVVRPTNAISIALVTLFVWRRYRASVIPYVLWAVPIAVAFVLYSLSVYGTLQPPYYSPGRIGHASTFGVALLGNLVSPARGVFVFSPVLLCAIYGAWLTLRARDPLGPYLVAIVVAHWLVISSFPHWYGGHSFGNRLFADMTPYLVYLTIPAISTLARLRGGRRVLWSGVVGCLIIVSFLINYRGANSRRVYDWNSDPVDVDVQPSRVWDWRDLQFLRGLGQHR